MKNISTISDLQIIGDGPVLVHSDALNTLRLVPRNRDLQSLADSHIERIRAVVDDRDVWMPSFNYTFTSSGKFDVRKDVSEVGLISERFRQIAEWRTPTPIFNFSGNGVMPQIEISPDTLTDPFGSSSAFSVLANSNGSILWYGAPIAAATILHYVESIGGSPLYRYDKQFSGIVSNYDCELNVTLNYHVRPLSGPLNYDWPRLTADAIGYGVIRKVTLENQADLYACDAHELVAYWLDNYAEDPFYFLDSPSRDWTEPLIEKLGRRFNINDFEGN